MLERWGETILGAIVIIVAVGFFAYAAAQGDKSRGGGGDYQLYARFQNVDGVSVGSDVLLSGVKIGVVRAVGIDPTTFQARLDLSLDPVALHFERCAPGAKNPPAEGCGVPDDSTARISKPLLGDAYVTIEPGAGNALASGHEIPNTQGAVDLLTVLSAAAQNMGSANNGQHAPSGSTP